MEGLIAREIAVAKELIAARKSERALLALRKKRLREGQLEQIDAYLLNVEQVLLDPKTCQLMRREASSLRLLKLDAPTTGAGEHRDSTTAKQAVRCPQAGHGRSPGPPEGKFATQRQNLLLPGLAC